MYEQKTLTLIARSHLQDKFTSIRKMVCIAACFSSDYRNTYLPHD